ncbi:MULTISPECIES: hypothetical protein [unclassified Dysgonomonas]|uniref:hypothetical protein n=1 Tax=unclassified Dysgonomonas TaxID=2630389 RepID=UPI00068107AB|nr:MULTISPECIES: hypothetical protein [unclassified Dysgonomonas]MBD8347023.1 hypothetical protein [Dysgonomonas sp. HGC4]MBF0574770.1 hypothetical protein [Dysgonomonas sp. GY617]
MDFEELSKHYMEKYNELTEKRDKSGIRTTIDDINEAIRGLNMDRVNDDYCKILDWNFYVANIEGARLALNAQFPYLRLPSATIFSIAFDQSEKKWKFNGEID